ncbi:hypothetical protein [Mammaliicoccus vitulinus]|uniref:hypothetical protein n=1 Tax=Mammaliicoccus vitulinus TaxID=71237 RepID=UPI00145ACD78|nr:hypothetical protein [Mammaliicoccus vitulinus]QJF24243.1 hypothetical protein HF021_01595 [Mammaliicoccus vitulinus]
MRTVIFLILIAGILPMIATNLHGNLTNLSGVLWVISGILFFIAAYKVIKKEEHKQY